MAVGQGDLSIERAVRGLSTTRRQWQHWIARGWLKAPGGTGTGYTTELPRAELSVLRKMAQLVDTGMRPEVAAKIARTAVAEGVRIVHIDTGVSILFKEEP